MARVEILPEHFFFFSSIQAKILFWNLHSFTNLASAFFFAEAPPFFDEDTTFDRYGTEPDTLLVAISSILSNPCLLLL